MLIHPAIFAPKGSFRRKTAKSLTHSLMYSKVQSTTNVMRPIANCIRWSNMNSLQMIHSPPLWVCYGTSTFELQGVELPRYLGIWLYIMNIYELHIFMQMFSFPQGHLSMQGSDTLGTSGMLPNLSQSASMQ